MVVNPCTIVNDDTGEFESSVISYGSESKDFFNEVMGMCLRVV